jgi:predicted unusual protein kinase regulating ubiquinone biosynthesis (AarF/ABC1/UbiB family)
MLLPGADLALVERVEARLLERFWGRSVAELAQVSFQEMRAVVGELRALLYAMPFQIPEDLILLGRTTGILSGLCTGLDRDFNAWPQMVPFARRLMAEDAAPIWEGVMDKLGAFGRALFAVPRQAENVLTRLEKGEMVLRMPALEEQASRLELTMRRLLGSVVFAGCLLSGAQLLSAGYTAAAGLLLAGAIVALIWVLCAKRA